ncbi:MAG: amidohydrolase family protein [Vicinamibacteria bacterium]|nr:amidohydrolase family protein [Vicinamibacteria bacterium]
MRVALTLSLLALGAVQPPPVAAPRAAMVIRGVSLIDGTGTPARPGISIVVRESRIAAIVAAGAEPPADLVVNGEGLFAIPGLIDAHVHLSGMPWAQRTEQLARVVRGGVTTVFDMAGDVRDTSHLSRAALTGEIDSPAIEYASLMAGPAFFTDPRVIASSRGYRPGEAPWNREVTADTDLVRAIAEAKGAGAHAIKLYAALDAATVARVGTEAARQNIRLVAHATTFPAKPSDLIAAGVKLLAHTPYLVWEGSAPSDDFPKRARGDFAGVPPDGEVMTRLLQSMKDRGVALNPTLWIFAEGPAKDDLAPVRTPWMNAVTRRAQAMGVILSAGTDSMIQGGDAWPMLHRELEAEVAAGLTPMEALVSATSGAARGLGIDGSRGTLAAGQAADIVLTDADPAADIRNTRRIRVVIKDGRLVHQAQIAGGR